MARISELRELIAAEEAKFKFVRPYRCEGCRLTRLRRLIVTEIDEIRSGAWDDRIRGSVRGAPERVEAPPEFPPSETIALPGEEPVKIAEAEVPTEPEREAQAVRFTACISAGLTHRHVRKEEEEESITREDVIEPTPPDEPEEKVCRSIHLFAGHCHDRPGYRRKAQTTRRSMN